MPSTSEVETATYADNTACLASDIYPDRASQKLQSQLDKIDQWLSEWRIKYSVSKSKHITFTLRKDNCPTVTMGGKELPSETTVKYLELHLDRRLTWAHHVKNRRKELNFQYHSWNWLIGHQSPLSLNNKLLVYCCVIKPIWTYGIELWGSTSNSNLEILQRFQNIVLRAISGARWFTRNDVIHKYLEIPTIKEEVNKYSKKHKLRLEKHPNILAQRLLTDTNTKRLKRWHILDLDER
ncbi:g16259 [Pararge aegeria aegeria]|uniref:G16259 protein n=1 Tax=Pararge aegeria aegeria TaxID=348720 RepID=A0A8S4RDP3_9NEOP|nr:g16259 [Pararge aegeria aegeria]